MAEPSAPRRYPFLPADPEIGWTPYLWLIYLLQVPLLHDLLRILNCIFLVPKQQKTKVNSGANNITN